MPLCCLGETRHELGGSEYLKVTHGLVAGVPPEVDLGAEKALQQLLVDGARERLIRSAHDCAEGGLAVDARGVLHSAPAGWG